MAIRGQRFNLNLDADNFQFDIQDDTPTESFEGLDVVKEIKEREPTAPPPPPKLKSKGGFPEHRPRKPISTFKQRQQTQSSNDAAENQTSKPPYYKPSDRAIAHHIGRKHGLDMDAKEKADISEENKRRLGEMSVEDIEQARAELMSGLNPALIERLLKRANIEEDQSTQNWDEKNEESPQDEDQPTRKTTKFGNTSTDQATSNSMEPRSRAAEESTAVENITTQSNYNSKKKVAFSDAESVSDAHQLKGDAVTGVDTASGLPASAPETHFPAPPRDPSSYKELDLNSSTFLDDLRTNYFPQTPHDPNVLSWLQDPSEEETKSSPYAPTQHAYAPSDIRFDFRGRLIPPSESETIPTEKGLHHHGDAPNSAGYTIPELAMLSRSTLPNQRCIAYQTLGRIFYRLGRGDFGPKGTELNEGLWACIEQERPLEVIMAEANRSGGHVSAKTYATEALWLWRRGGGGDRGILKEGQRIVR